MDHEFFRSLEYPNSDADAIHIIQRMIGGLGFRYYWATDGLRDEDYAFSVSEDSMTIEALCMHILGLSKMIGQLLNCPPQEADQQLHVREKTLHSLYQIYHHIEQQDESSLTKIENFWNLFNGPLGDAFSHVGQLNSWRRINGNPIAKVRFFHGTA